MSDLLPEVPVADDVTRIPQATVPRKVPKRAKLDHPALYFNRELSWLDFNWRVFSQAMDERNPLMERVRFVFITYNNLDEFCRKRMGGLKRQEAAGVTALSPDGRTPAEQLQLSREAVRPMYQRLFRLFKDELKPKLARDLGVHIKTYSEVTAEDRAWLNTYFRQHIFPVLTPLAVDPGHPFPFISNLSLSLAVMLKHPARGTEHFARLKIPVSRGRWIRLPREKQIVLVAIEDVIRHNLLELFRGMEILSAHLFRITRNADVGREEDETEDLIDMIAEELRERRFAPVVRMEVEEGMPDGVRSMLMRELSLTAEDVYECPGPLDLRCCNELANLPTPAHQYPVWEPVVPTRLMPRDRTIFEVISAGDLLVHHPYESFKASVQRFVEEAAEDEKVVAIKQTLYRTSDESPVVEALIRAAENGIQVAVLIEVKARFDEENNIEWGQTLEKAGVHVTYGVMGLKTHSKVTLVIREEEDGPRTYCHIGTGNYHPKTARLYTDLGLFTCHPEIGYDLINLFHYLTGYAPEQHYKHIMVAPRSMRTQFEALIRAEIDKQRRGGKGRIIAKMNALDDVRMIQELYRASMAGVQIDLVVRGHSRLRPGLLRYSENIRLISIVGRFLEHSRIYQFGEGDDARVFMGSADWQRRNLDDRVEVIIEVKDPIARNRMMRTLELALEDHRLSWDLHPDGRYMQRFPRTPADEAGLHAVLMDRAKQRVADMEHPWDLH